MEWLWVLAGLIVIGSAGFGVFKLFSSGAFVSAALKELVPIIWNAVVPMVMKRKTPEEETRDHQDVRQRTERTITGRER